MHLLWSFDSQITQVMIRANEFWPSSDSGSLYNQKEQFCFSVFKQLCTNNQFHLRGGKLCSISYSTHNTQDSASLDGKLEVTVGMRALTLPVHLGRSYTCLSCHSWSWGLALGPEQPLLSLIACITFKTTINHPSCCHPSPSLNKSLRPENTPVFLSKLLYL